MLMMMEDVDLYSKAHNYFAAGLVSLTMLAFSATAWAGGFYADVHGGTGITWNETARVSSDAVSPVDRENVSVICACTIVPVLTKPFWVLLKAPLTP